jgi:preprotein translocase subunit SecA
MEAKIVSEAGRIGAVTIATNMAGRGTDIALEEGVKELGGLYVIGSERHESRRIDNQLRGRSGRQGDPGESRFYVSFEDDLMRLFGGERMQMLMSQVGLDDGTPITSGILGRTIENAQKKVEAHNYDIRKRLVDYDDVLNQQREIIYTLRKKILEAESSKKIPASKLDLKKELKTVKDLDVESLQDSLDGFSLAREDTWNIQELSEITYPLSPLEKWILKKVFEHLDFLVASQLQDDMKIDNIEERKLYIQIENLLTSELLSQAVKELGYKDTTEMFREMYELQEVERMQLLKRVILISFMIHIYSIGLEPMQQLSKYLILQSFDRFWMEHLDTMTDLREGISLRNLAQRDPLVEYKNEGFNMFEEMLRKIDEFVVIRFFKVRLVRNENQTQQRVDSNKDTRPGNTTKQKTIKKSNKVGRNDPCPCGSGKKYKKCCYPKYG